MAEALSFDDLIPTGTPPGPAKAVEPATPLSFDDLIPGGGRPAPSGVEALPSSPQGTGGLAKAPAPGPSVSGESLDFTDLTKPQPIPEPLEVTQGAQQPPTAQPPTTPDIRGFFEDPVRHVQEKLASDKAAILSEAAAVARGFNRAQANTALFLGSIGQISPAEAEAEFRKQMAEAAAWEPQVHPSVEVSAKKYALTSGVADSLAVLAENPLFISYLLGEQVPNIAVTTGAAIAGGVAGSAVAGPPGTVAGLVTAGGAASGGIEYVNALQDFLQNEKGMDLDSEGQISSALVNKELMAEARVYAIKRGVSVGAIDAITSLLGAKGAGRYLVDYGTKGFSKAGAKAAGEIAQQRLAAEVAVNTAIEASGGVLGEGLAQYSTKGTVHVPDLVLEGLLEIPGSAPEAAYSTYVARKQFNADRPPTEEELQRAMNVEVLERKVESFNKATAEGRTKYGFVLKDAPTEVPVQVFDNYSKAETAIGPRDVREGILFAVKPTEIFADAGGREFTTKEIAAKNEIATREQNLFIAGKNNSLVLDVVVDGKPGSVILPTVTDLDELQTVLEQNGVQAIPEVEALKGFYVKHGPTGRRIVDEALTFVDQEARDQFDAIASTEAPTSTEERVFMRSGKVTFRRLDVRVLTSPLGRPRLQTITPLNSDAAGKLAATLGTRTKVVLPPDTKARYTRPDSNEGPGRLDGRGTKAYIAQAVAPHLQKTVKAIIKLYEEFGKHFPNAADVDIAFVDRDGFNHAGLPSNIAAFLNSQRQILGRTGGVYFITPALQRPLIYIGVQRDSEPAFLYGTATHEYGHHLAATEFAAAPLTTRVKIFSAFRRAMRGSGRVAKVPRDAVRQTRVGWFIDKTERNEFNDYFLNFDEWMAEQVARWASTDRRPLGVVSKFFRGLAKEILYVLSKGRRLAKAHGVTEQFTPEQEIAEWLNSLLTGRVSVVDSENLVRIHTKEIVDKRARGDAREEESENVASVLNSVKGSPNVPVRQILKDVDHFNKFMKWAYGFRHLADANPHIDELQRYRELIERAQLEANRIMAIADERVKRWRDLGPQMGGKLAQFLIEIQEMTYRTPDEQKRGVRRWPTSEEFLKLYRQYGLNADAIALYNDIKKDFLLVVARQHDLQIKEAGRIQDPALRAKAIAVAEDMTRRLTSGPYFPYTRFGNWAVSERNANGHLVHFELFETQREQLQAYKNAVAALRNQGVANPEQLITASTVPEDVQQFVGVPPWLMDKLMELPGLSIEQKKWMEQLRYQLAPATSWRKHLLSRKGLPGFSWDGRRVYAKYFFHHARQYARLKYEGDIRTVISALKEAQRAGGVQNARTRIAEYLEDHFAEFINPSKDFTLFRSITAVWHLGFMPVSAALNLTQSTVMTMPFLSTKFGDVKAMAAMTNAASQLTTYYKRGAIAQRGMTDKKMEALALAVEEGLITESQAAELAAITVGNFNYARSLFGDKVRTGWLQFSDKAMWMFQMAEQWNRRVTFRAAYDLAMANPQAKWLQELRNLHFLRYTELMATGTWTDQETLAYLAGKEAILKTHYSYDRASRPRFMRGRKAALFAFYMFTHNSLMTLWQNPGVIPRYMIMMVLLGGLTGLIPDEVDDIVRFIGYKLFGKDWNPDKDIKEFLVQMMGEDPAIPPDLILHGSGRYGFGIPAAMQMAGATWAPNFDMSKSVALNRILPGAPTALLRPGVDFERAVADAVKQTSGAAYGIPFALYKVANSSDLDLRDTKTWEEAMPRAMRSITRAFRLLSEGGERNKAYQITTPFDSNDNQHIAELIGLAMGFQPTRLARDQEQRGWEYEANAYQEISRQLLLRQAYKTRFIDKDKEAFKEVLEDIKKYNAQVPDKKFRITAETLQKSSTQRQKAKGRMEAGQNPQIAPGIRSSIQKLFPEDKIIEERKVK